MAECYPPLAEASRTRDEQIPCGAGGVRAQVECGVARVSRASRTAWLLLAGVFLLKLIALSQLYDHPLLHPDAGLDTTAYADLAGRVVRGEILLRPGLYYVSPFYIDFLAAGLWLFDAFTAVRPSSPGMPSGWPSSSSPNAIGWPSSSRYAWLLAGPSICSCDDGVQEQATG